jgi:hypothetical protein
METQSVNAEKRPDTAVVMTVVWDCIGTFIKAVNVRNWYKKQMHWDLPGSGCRSPVQIIHLPLALFKSVIDIRVCKVKSNELSLNIVLSL